MEILQKIEKDFNQAFKAKNELVVLVLRQLKTALTNAEIANKREKLKEEEVMKIFHAIEQELKRVKILFTTKSKNNTFSL